MKLSKKHKKFIKQSYKNLSVEELSKKLKLDEKTIKAYLKETGRIEKVKNFEGDDVLVLNSPEVLFKFLKRNIPFIILLILLCWAIYSNSLKGEFVSDDINGYVTNEFLRSPKMIFMRENLRDAFSIQTIVYLVFFNIFKINPIPLHALSITLHCLATIMAFIITYSLFGKKISIISTLIFAAHPINTEVINWISGNVYLLNAITIFSIMITYILFKNSNKRRYLVISSIIYVVGVLFVKNPWILTAPFILVVMDQLLIEKKINPKIIVTMLPFIVFTLLYVVVFYLPTIFNRVEYVKNLNKGFQETLPFTITIPYTILMTIKLLVYPIALTFYHEGEPLGETFFFIAKVITIAFPFIVGFFWKKKRVIAGAILIILLSLLPSLSPVQIAWYMADRYLYIGSLFFGSIVAYIFLAIEKKSNIKNFAMIATVVLLITYSIRTVIRNSDWRTPKRLWLATREVAPSSPRVYNNLGDIYSNEKNYEQSIRAFETALKINPNYADAMHNLGRTYLLMGELDKAEGNFVSALKIKPELFQSYYTLGVIETKRGDMKKAEAYFLKSLEINPKYLDAQRGLNFTKQNAN